MSQYIINTGNIANDGQGDPLRTAFTDTNLNFNQIWAAGPVNSNIKIANNTIITTNTNGNLILATNGIGAIVTAQSVVPDLSNVRMVGGPNNRFNTVYSQYLDISGIVTAGNLSVSGNLYVAGNTVTVNQSNLSVSNTLITLAANATIPVEADGGGIFVAGANASLTYSSSLNSWVANIALSVQGNVSADYFVGDGSGLSNLNVSVDANTLTGNRLNSGVVFSNLTTVGTLTSLTVDGNVLAGNITATFYGDGSHLSNLGNVGNAVYATFAGTAATANLAAQAVTAINADTALYAVNANTANTANFALTSNCAIYADTATTAILANSAIVANVALFAESVGILANLSVTGNIVAGGILTNNYYYANGAPFAGGGSGSIIQSPTAPLNPTASTLWWDEVSGRLYVYYNDGATSQWVDAAPAGTGGGGGSASLVQSPTPPTNPTANTLWWDEVSGRLYVYYDDGTSSQWVDASPAGTGGGGSTGNITFNSTTISTNLADTDIAIQGNGTGAINIVTGANSYTALQNNSYANGSSGVYLQNGNVYVETVNAEWNFDSSGGLTFPDNTVQTTAYTGSGGGATDWANIGNITGANGPTSVSIGQNAYVAPTYGVPGQLKGIVWAGTQFVAGGQDTNGNVISVTTANGSTWTNHFTNIVGSINSIVWNGTNQYVGVGTDESGALIVTSPDGVTWTQQAIGSFPGSLASVTWSGAQYVASGETYSNSSQVVTSPDGINWTNQAGGAIATVGLQSVVWNGVDQYVAVGSIYIDPSPSYYYAAIYTSPDAITWTAQQEGVYTSILNSVIWDSGRSQYVAGGNAGYVDGVGVPALILTSTDGVNWTQQAQYQFLNVNISNIAVDTAGDYLAVSNDNACALLSSSDGGVSWTQQAQGLISNAQLRGLAYNPATDLFVATGYAILKSTGISSWSVVAYPTSSDSIAIGNSAGNSNQYSSAVAIGSYAGANTQSTSAVAVGSNAGSEKQGQSATAVGQFAGSNQQGVAAVAVGQFAAYYVQGEAAVAVGQNAGSTSQGNSAVAIGQNAGQNSQGKFSVAIGLDSGSGSGSNAVAVGARAGTSNQGVNSVAIGAYAGSQSQPASTIILNATGVAVNGVSAQTNSFYVAPVRNDTGNTTNALYYNTSTKEISYGPAGAGGNTDWANIGNITINGPTQIAIGENAGIGQGAYTVAIGAEAGTAAQGAYGIAIGQAAGANFQGLEAVAIGSGAGLNNQGETAVGIGYNAGQTTQGNSAVAIGRLAALSTQGNSAVAIGEYAGNYYQGDSTVAIGANAGNTTQGDDGVAIGNRAGSNTQGIQGIAIGSQAAQTTQGTSAIAIGTSAGFINQGDDAIAIGRNAGINSQPPNSIILNASGNQLNGSGANALYIAPVRNDTSNITNALYYNTSTFEISYGPAAAGGNVSSLANSTATFTLLSDNTLLSGTVASPQNFKVNDAYTPDIDLRNASGTGSFTQGANLTLRTSGTYNWVFGNTGTTQFPNNTINPGNNQDLTIRTQSSGNAYTEVGQQSNQWVAQTGDDTTAANPAFARIGTDLITTDEPVVFIQTQKGSDGLIQTWEFSRFGNLILPDIANPSINYANGAPYGGSGGNYGDSNVTTLLGAFGSNSISTTGSVTAGQFDVGANLYIGPGPGGGSFVVANVDTSLISLSQGANGQSYFGWTENLLAPGNLSTITFNTDGNAQGNAVITTGSDSSPYQWKFGNDGSLTPPTQPSNQRTGTGLVLKIGDTNTQAIITGPAPVANTYNAAPRLVIAGQDGVLNGEGGDIYLWGGQSGPDGGSGGDIKVDGGQGLNGSEGGTVKIRGGYSNPGNTGSAYGGFVEIYAGSGNIGGPVDIRSGQGNSTANTGNITLTVPGVATWTFGNDGNLTLPNNIIGGGNLRLVPNSGSPGAYLDVYLTTGPDIHIAGNGENVIVGRDSGANVTVGADGNVTVRADAGTAQNWIFGNDGELYLPTGGRVGATKGGTMLDGGAGNSVSLTSFYANGYYAGCFTASPDGNAYITTYTGSENYSWNFDNTGALNLPVIGSGPFGGYQGIIQTANAYPTLLAYGLGGHGGPELDWINSDNSANFSNSDTVRNTLYLNGDAGLYVGFNENGNTGPYTGHFQVDTLGNVQIPSQNVGASTPNGTPGEATYLRGTRKVINGVYTGAQNPFAVELTAGPASTVVYTATNQSVQSVRVTFAVQSTGNGYCWEQFDVVATPSQDTPGTVNYVVSNRIKSTSTVTDTQVTATINGGNQIEISLVPMTGQNGWASFDAVEFGLMVD